MSAFFAIYYSWAIPNVMAALATATVAGLLLRRSDEKRAIALPALILTQGAAVASVVILSLAANFAGLAPSGPAGIAGIIAGVVSSLLLRPSKT